MTECWFLHNSGLGDHIIYNGLVRELSKNYDKLYLFCSSYNLNNVVFMYRDDPKIIVVDCCEDKAYDYWKANGKGSFKSTLLRFKTPDLEYEQKWSKFSHFDQIPYFMEGIPFGFKTTSFYYQRDTEAEYKLFQELHCHENPNYIFIHDSSSLGQHIVTGKQIGRAHV